MISRKKIIYVPALRMKKGELDGLRLLQGDVADCIAPLLIVPPAKERNCSSQELLFPAGNDVPDVGGALFRYWTHRQAFIDPGVLFKEYGADKAASWLPVLYKRARSQSVLAIPVANLVLLEQIGVAAFKGAISADTGLKFGLRIQSGDMTDPSLDDRVRAVLISMGLTA